MYNKFVTSDGGKKDLRCLTMNTGKLLEVHNLHKFYNKDGVLSTFSPVSIWE